ncbi:hypothetical protein [Hymenobacter cellulosilyticus]|uniref:Uncharacterized protein n=1 Tax=Hymenobacter cellulosilyticus TaxID=2932248 RepID=A0A8T9QD93_9BACT|nr:hypothetical protein [Hymenobacter cellulosilyticus]UOQ72803.1 hypothetical protein MUN79_02070 [Hymenobacter cellulosilyticus]
MGLSTAAMFRGARTYMESEGFVALHNLPHIGSITSACQNTDTLFTLINRDNVI